MRNLILAGLLLGLCGCRVELLQLLGATVDSNEARAQRGLAPLELSELTEEEEEAIELAVPDVSFARLDETENFVDGGIPIDHDAGVVETDASVHLVEICTDVLPGGSCPSFGRACPEGFWGEQGTVLACHEIDECLHELHDCAENQRCENTVGSFVCHDEE